MARAAPHSNKVILGILGLASMAFISSWNLGASSLAGLRSIEIRPYGDFTINPGETLLMTVEGDYGTYSVPIMGAWRITQGKDYGWLATRCDANKTCELQAGEYGGNVHVYVDAYGLSHEAVVTIREPAPPKVVNNPFNDGIPDWASEPIVRLRDKNIIRGYDDGRYGAGDLLTRGQLITIFHRTLTSMNLLPASDCQQVYKDVPAGHYAYNAACVFRNNGWADSLSTLGVNDPVTRGETASLLNRVLGSALMNAHDMRISDVTANGQIFTDVPENHQYFIDTAVTRALSLMKGNPDRTFGVSQTLNRAEAATIFFRAMDALENEGVRGV